MKLQHIRMAALAIALGASGIALAATADKPFAMEPMPTESILVQGMPFRGAYGSEMDGVLLVDAFRAVDADRATNTALLTMVADNGALTVNGWVTDIAQGARIDAKLRALHGGTRVISWYDTMGSGE